MGDAPVRDQLVQAIKDGDARTALAIGLRSRMEADRGNVCQCPEPEHVIPGGGKGDLMCGICGLQDQAAVARYEAELRCHAFVESDHGLRREIGWCAFCARLREHPNHDQGSGDESA